VVDAAKSVVEEAENFFIDIWKSFDVNTQDAFQDLTLSGPTLLGDIRKNARRELIAAGFAKEVGNHLETCCRLMQEILKENTGTESSMPRLFGSRQAYAENISELLYRRLDQISPFHDFLFRLVKSSIESLRNHPSMSLSHFTDIRDSALRYIFTQEFGPQGEIPVEIISYWSGVQDSLPAQRKDRLIQSMMEADEKGSQNAWMLPRNPGQQIHMLRLLVGADENFNQRQSKVLTKEVYTLIDHVHGYRNLKEHLNGEDLGLGAAVTALMTCVELLACLEKKEEV
jgi:hypothetical protein